MSQAQNSTYISTYCADPPEGIHVTEVKPLATCTSLGKVPWQEVLRQHSARTSHCTDGIDYLRRTTSARGSADTPRKNWQQTSRSPERHTRNIVPSGTNVEVGQAELNHYYSANGLQNASSRPITHNVPMIDLKGGQVTTYSSAGIGSQSGTDQHGRTELDFHVTRVVEILNSTPQSNLKLLPQDVQQKLQRIGAFNNFLKGHH